MNDDYTPIMLTKSQTRRLSREHGSPIRRGYYVQGMYDHDTDRIYLTKYPKRETIEQIKEHNRGERIHRAGFRVRPRRSYEKVERQLPGFKKIESADDHYGRIISHESLHKVIRKQAGSEASHKLDDIYAAKGYHGIVRSERHFVVGEAGPERVNITPIRKIQRLKTNNFRINIGVPKSRKTPSIFGNGSLGKLARF